MARIIEKNYMHSSFPAVKVNIIENWYIRKPNHKQILVGGAIFIYWLIFFGRGWPVTPPPPPPPARSTRCIFGTCEAFVFFYGQEWGGFSTLDLSYWSHFCPLFFYFFIVKLWKATLNEACSSLDVFFGGGGNLLWPPVWVTDVVSIDGKLNQLFWKIIRISMSG